MLIELPALRGIQGRTIAGALLVVAFTLEVVMESSPRFPGTGLGVSTFVGDVILVSTTTVLPSFKGLKGRIRDAVSVVDVWFSGAV
jgi:hypothetical protein